VILDKIDNCDIFVADLTCVGKTWGRRSGNGKLRRKRIPNPNVMLEAGYAAGVIPYNQIVQVMNTAFGGPKYLPFDLKGKRHPIQYDLPHERGSAPDPAKVAKAKTDLIKVFKTAIGDMITSGVTGRGAEEAKKAEAARLKVRETEIAQERQVFEDRVDKGEFYDLKANRGVISISVFPAVPTSERPWEGQQIHKLLHYLLPDAMQYGTQLERDQGVIYCRFPFPTGDKKVVKAASLVETGALFYAYNRFFFEAGGEGFDPKRQQKWEFGDDQAKINKTIGDYILSLKEMNVPGPWLVCLSLLKMRNVQLVPDIQFTLGTRAFDRDRIAARPVTISATDDVSTFRAVESLMKRAWTDIWDISGAYRLPVFNDSGKFVE